MYNLLAMINSLIPLGESREILYTSQFLGPVILFVGFGLFFGINGILTAPEKNDEIEVSKLGPGGRPLPMRRKSNQQIKAAVATKDFSPAAKLVFKSICVAVMVTYFANAANGILQVMVYRNEQWWPGKEPVVSAKRSKLCA